MFYSPKFTGKSSQNIASAVDQSILGRPPRGYYPRWTFSSGVLEMQAEDASALRLEVDNGNMSTVQVTLLQDGLEIEVFQQPWSLWQNTLNFIARDPRD